MRNVLTSKALPLGTLLVFALLAVLALAACGGAPKAQRAESKTQQGNYSRLVAQQPAHSMSYSPTRDTINFWIDTWGKEPGKLAYVYLQAASGDLIGYYVFKGLPVSYCVGLTPPYSFVGVDGDGTDEKWQVPAPAMDGVYYGGCNTNTFYGKDASTGAYIEYTVGLGQNVLLYDRPLPRQDVEPLGFTTVAEAKGK